MFTPYSAFLLLFLASLFRSGNALNLTTVFDFGNGTFLENLVVESSNRILVTTIVQNTIYRVDPAVFPASATPYVVLSGAGDPKGILSIKEYRPGKFAFLAGTIDSSSPTPRGSNWRVYSLDTSQDKPLVQVVASGFNASLLNGMSVLPAADSGANGVYGDDVLISESIAGVIWRVNLSTGSKQIVIRDEVLTPRNPATRTPVGVNGILVHGRELFFANTERGIFGYIPIRIDGTQAGPPTVLATAPHTDDDYDDFAIRETGVDGKYRRRGRANAFAIVATHPNSVNRIELAVGAVKQTEFSDARLGPVGPTSVAFGRGKYQNIAYVTTGDGRLFSFDIREIEEKQ